MTHDTTDAYDLGAELTRGMTDDEIVAEWFTADELHRLRDLSRWRLWTLPDRFDVPRQAVAALARLQAVP